MGPTITGLWQLTVTGWDALGSAVQLRTSGSKLFNFSAVCTIGQFLSGSDVFSPAGSPRKSPATTLRLSRASTSFGSYGLSPNHLSRVSG